MSNRNSLYMFAVTSALAVAGAATGERRHGRPKAAWSSAPGSSRPARTTAPRSTNACHGHVDEGRAAPKRGSTCPRAPASASSGARVVKVKDPDPEEVSTPAPEPIRGRSTEGTAHEDAR